MHTSFHGYNLLISFQTICTISYITVEELEHALKEYGMAANKDINEIVSEVDADNVRIILPLSQPK